MLPWFLRDPSRLSAERRAIADLAREVDWLAGHEWNVSGGLCVDFVVRSHGHDYELRLEFPALFPDVPIVVRPRNADVRWTTHQYGGPTGPLCLEWGPDNWNSAISAREMIESAQRLLEIENPLGVDKPRHVISAPSRHSLAQGQAVRGALVRWLFNPEFEAFLASRGAAASGLLKYSLQNLGESWTVLVHEASAASDEVWSDGQIPLALPGARPADLSAGVWAKSTLSGEAIGAAKTHSELRKLLDGEPIAGLLAEDSVVLTSALPAIAVVDATGAVHLFLVLADGTALKCTAVRQTGSDSALRAPESALLAERRIGIVGLGAAGSKIATSLARMGVRHFYLIDYDVLLPENLQRHAASWQGVTQHKVDVVAALITQIDSRAKVEVSRLHLTGQESNAAISGVLARLSECDVIIDATAEGRVFNLTSAVAKRFSRSLVWLEIFGGGIGGLVARSRHELDPSPEDMRSVYLHYCAANPAPASLQAATDYSTSADNGGVLVASDADVGIISHHAARLAVDCARDPAESQYPFSMYLIGLSKAWVFDAPFDTKPVSTSYLPLRSSESPESAEVGVENLEFLAELIQKGKQ